VDRRRPDLGLPIRAGLVAVAIAIDRLANELTRCEGQSGFV
jgi:hypothetical protein